VIGEFIDLPEKTAVPYLATLEDADGCGGVDVVMVE
jgi:hypothetical protein